MRIAAVLLLLLAGCGREEVVPAPADSEAAAKAARIVTGQEPIPVASKTPLIPPEAIVTPRLDE